MSKEDFKNSEEVDLEYIISLISKVFDRVNDFIVSIFKTILNIFVSVIVIRTKNFKLLLTVFVISLLLGYTLEKLTPNVYKSSTLVKPYFESKYQLVSNIEYFNALLSSGDFDQLASIFKVEKEKAKELVSFEVAPGPETENDHILEYEKFIKKIDSTRAQDITFETFIEQRNIYSGSTFLISVLAKEKDIFTSLENGLNVSFANKYSLKKRRKRDSLLDIEKIRILKSLSQIDSLKRVYVETLQKESSQDAIIISSTGTPIIKQKVDTREYDLLSQELKLRKSLSDLDVRRVESNDLFDVISSFQNIGTVYIPIWKRYTIIFPIIAFILLVLGYTKKKLVSFSKTYKYEWQHIF